MYKNVLSSFNGKSMRKATTFLRNFLDLKCCIGWEFTESEFGIFLDSLGDIFGEVSQQGEFPYSPYSIKFDDWNVWVWLVSKFSLHK